MFVLGLLIVLGSLFGLVYYFITSPKYQATATFIVEEKSSGSGLAGMAGQLGFDISSLTGGNAGLFDGDNILEIIKSERFEFTRSRIEISYGENLCEKAWKLLDTDFGIGNVKIHLHKQIPIGAGLGGGSADASFTLKYLTELFDLNLNKNSISIMYVKLVNM